MKLFGVTGGVGMGKSTVASLLLRLDAAVVDTDAIAHQLTQPGQPALAEISRTFGPAVFQPDGALDRVALARLVFSDAQSRAQLEVILHPPIRAIWQVEVEQWRHAGRAIGAVIIPLLFETHAEGNFDAVICVACSIPTQEKRLRERGWSPAQMAARIAAQLPIDQKITRSDFVVWTGADLEAVGAQLEKIIDTSGKRQRTPACA
jgi:dephospho-CoA kinase